MLSYDPDRTPQIDPETIARGLELGLHPINVVCDEPGSKVGEATGVNFVAFGAFVPRVGERVTLEDGKSCEVRRVYYRVTQVEGVIALVPNVYAVSLGDNEK